MGSLASRRAFGRRVGAGRAGREADERSAPPAARPMAGQSAPRPAPDVAVSGPAGRLRVPTAWRSRPRAIRGDDHEAQHAHDRLGGVHVSPIALPPVRPNSARRAAALLDPAVQDHLAPADGWLARLEKLCELGQRAAHDHEVLSRRAKPRAGAPSSLGGRPVRAAATRHRLASADAPCWWKTRSPYLKSRMPNRASGSKSFLHRPDAGGARCVHPSRLRTPCSADARLSATPSSDRSADPAAPEVTSG
jgi:hypothetical protein